MLDKSACVLVSDILGSATGDVQPAMDAIASLAAAELHPGGKDGEVMCYYKTSIKVAGAVKTQVSENIITKRVLTIINSPHTNITFKNWEFKTTCHYVLKMYSC